jgi:hypothetical protein
MPAQTSTAIKNRRASITRSGTPSSRSDDRNSGSDATARVHSATNPALPPTHRLSHPNRASTYYLGRPARTWIRAMRSPLSPELSE